MAEWLYEAGIGEARAILVEDDRVLHAAIELEGGAPRVDAVLRARLIDRLAAGQGRVALAGGVGGGGGGGEAHLAQVPPGLTQGAALTVRITREPIPEPGRLKLAKAVATDALPAPAPDLLARIAATGLPVSMPQPHQADTFEAAGWSELLDEAMSGDIAFPGGMLRLSPTPAMTLFDVDGGGPVEALAVAAAAAVAAAILRHGIGGSIGIDFPTLPDKAARARVAAVIDAALPQPFERTAVNGFGFLQIVRPRPRASIPERLRADPVGAAARAALRSIERTPPGTTAPHRLPPAVHAAIVARPDWLAELTRRTGAVPTLESA